MKKLSLDQILGIVRHSLTTIGGYLVAIGVYNAEFWTEVSASILIAIGTVWSVIDKLKRNYKK